MTTGKSKNTIDSTLEEITRTVLYEGYTLFPYYRSSPKNMKPVPFGAVYPREYQEVNQNIHSSMQTECMLMGTHKTTLHIRIRFLHLRNRPLLAKNPEEYDHENRPELLKTSGQDCNYGWDAVEREIRTGKYLLSELENKEIGTEIHFPSEQLPELSYGENGAIAGNTIFGHAVICGKIALSAKQLENKKGFQVSIKVANTTPVEHPKQLSRDEIYDRTFLSPHIILMTEDGIFISQTDPPVEWAEAVGTCNNINTWPVLIDPGDRIMLSSPLVLYDHPKIAPESTGDLFDSTEIEEALLLHLSTLTDREKEKIDGSDQKLKTVLDRIERITPDELLKLHGGFKDTFPPPIKKKGLE